MTNATEVSSHAGVGTKSTRRLPSAIARAGSVATVSANTNTVDVIAAMSKFRVAEYTSKKNTRCWTAGMVMMTLISFPGSNTKRDTKPSTIDEMPTMKRDIVPPNANMRRCYRLQVTRKVCNAL